MKLLIITGLLFSVHWSNVLAEPQMQNCALWSAIANSDEVVAGILHIPVLENQNRASDNFSTSLIELHTSSLIKGGSKNHIIIDISPLELRSFNDNTFSTYVKLLDNTKVIAMLKSSVEEGRQRKYLLMENSLALSAYTASKEKEIARIAMLQEKLIKHAKIRMRNTKVPSKMMNLVNGLASETTFDDSLKKLFNIKESKLYFLFSYLADTTRSGNSTVAIPNPPTIFEGHAQYHVLYIGEVVSIILARRFSFPEGMAVGDVSTRDLKQLENRWLIHLYGPKECQHVPQG